MTSTSFPKRRSRGSGRRATRVDVVHETDARRCRSGRREGARDVAPPLLQAETALAFDAPGAAHQRLDGNVPAPTELDGERLGRCVASPQGAVVVTRDEHERRCLGRRQRLDYEIGGLAGQPPPALLLPGGHEPTGTGVVEDRRAGTCEGDPAPGALRTPPHRPGAGRAAPRAERRGEPNQGFAARVTERRAGIATACAALREDELEHTSKLGPWLRRKCNAFVSVV